MLFRDRVDAAEQLAEKIEVTDPENTVVLALPRGGIPLGLVLSEKFRIPLDVLLSKKIGHPMHSEYAIGAVAEGGEPLLNQGLQVDSDWLDQDVKRIRQEMARRRKLYDEVLTKQPLEGKDLIIVDDGIATGMTMFAAIDAAKKENPKSITAAVPVMPKDTHKKLLKLADRVSAVEVPRNFLGAVGAYYESFPQLEDSEIQEVLKSYSEEST